MRQQTSLQEVIEDHALERVPDAQRHSWLDLSWNTVGIVTTLSSTTPILILPMVWMVHGRLPGPMAWIGAALAVFGTAMIGLAT